ncbi:hypothetical protein ACGC1H_002165 [Rhizoctonia solani]
MNSGNHANRINMKTKTELTDLAGPHGSALLPSVCFLTRLDRQELIAKLRWVVFGTQIVRSYAERNQLCIDALVRLSTLHLFRLEYPDYGKKCLDGRMKSGNPHGQCAMVYRGVHYGQEAVALARMEEVRPDSSECAQADVVPVPCPCIVSGIDCY